ncbi:MAG: transporter [Verrucomicrobia bacterium]|nr:transporter [Verrucomicrobiota bacterium]MBS0637150.1 transporter [Verrucomicrobiota bacterium]
MLRYVALFLCTASILKATEGAFPLYLNGYNVPKSGYMPPPGLYARNDIYHHNGHVKGSVIGGLATVKANVKISFDVLGLTYISHLKLLEANIGCGVIVPVGRINVHGTLSATIPTVGTQTNALGIPVPQLQLQSITKKKHQVAHGIADTLVIPFMLGWHAPAYDLHIIAFQGVFIPTGKFDKNKIANMGQNHYALETDAGFTWLSTKWGTEVSAITGITTNFTNHKIHYKSGAGWHTDFYIGQYVTSNLEIGLSGYWFYQLTPDSGKGAKLLNGFRSRVLGLGPSISYEFTVAKVPVTVNARYFKETHSKNYLKGDTFYLTVTVPIP